MTDKIQQTMKKFIPTKDIYNYHYKLPDYITNKIKIRNYYKRRHQRTRSVYDKNIYISLVKDVRYSIKEYHNKQIEFRLKTLNIKDHTLWKAIKMRKKSNNTIPTLHSKQGLVYDDKSKAEAIADVFEETHNLTRDMSDKATEKQKL
ncbi:Protein of unknown function [Cotesia congregata]|uniref:Uncharacterized protein n=1 Tax=Cotesia congregata TaxID=51543 RepID=A0A8J2HK53_COTCN|nr:Protein of unknown function [Cotesia congregata]